MDDGPARSTSTSSRSSSTTDEIDTVLVVFPDLQGRLMGKRVTGRFFRDHVLDGSIEACNYLLAVDVDMTPLPGYRYANWDQGYGDFSAVPDLATLRLVPWIEKTALVLCDLVDEEGRRARSRCRPGGSCAARSSGRPRWATGQDRRRARVLPVQGDLRRGGRAGDYRDAHPARRLDRGLPHPPDDPGRVPHPPDPQRHGRGRACRSSSRRARPAGASTRSTSCYAEALEMADRHAIYKNGAKEIADLNGRSLTFMAKYVDGRGRLVLPHPLERLGRAGSTLAACGTPRTGDHFSKVFQGWLGGLVARVARAVVAVRPVRELVQAVPARLVGARPRWPGADDNRTCGLRVVGHGAGYRVECRIPGADVNPYLAYAGMIAAGLHGIEHDLDPGPPFEGNAYEDPDVPRIPSTLVEAIELFERSEVAQGRVRRRRPPPPAQHRQAGVAASPTPSSPTGSSAEASNASDLGLRWSCGP